MSPISFSNKFVLLSLKGSQNLIGKSSLGVIVDNIKLIDLFSALKCPLYQTQIGPICFIHINIATKRL